MKKNYTHLSILLDRSGSMASIKKNIIEGFNSLINDQKKEKGELTVSLVQFDSGFVLTEERKNNRFSSQKLRYDILNDFTNLDSVQLLTEMNYIPDGGTPLNDALATLIKETGNKLASLNEDERPEKVIVVALTDGQENSSTEFSTKDIKEMIEHQEKTYNWKFIYVGANQDAFAESSARGMSGALNFAANGAGTKSAFVANSKVLSKVRSMSNDAYMSYSANAVTDDLSTEYNAELNKNSE